MSSTVSSAVGSTVSSAGIAGIVPMIDLNPVHWLGDKAKEVAADGFTSMMMGLWSAAMWLLQMAFKILDRFVIPNVQDPDLKRLYEVTLWISLVMALVIAFGQIGLAVIRQDGRGFGTLLAGVLQYGAVVSCWIVVCGGLIAATGGLTTGILRALLGVDDFSGYAVGDDWVDTVSGTVEAATLGVCAIFVLIPAAFGYLVIMLVRAATLLILTATMPIAAAGALSEGTKSWMWKSMRWFLASALMSPLLALVIGLGAQIAHAGFPDGAQTERPEMLGKTFEVSSTSTNIGMSVVGSVIMLVACFTPMVLFRLLAFVDPGTASGASFRSTMSANGGVAGLLGGKPGSAGVEGSGAATQTASDGRTASESGADAETANRFQSKAARALPAVGGAIGGAMARAGKAAQFGAAMGIDVLGQSGVGNQGYYDTGHYPRATQRRRRAIHDHQLDHQLDHELDRDGDTGVANDVPPGAQVAVEDGAFLA
jgi:type IV secretion system protein TrbL